MKLKRTILVLVLLMTVCGSCLSQESTLPGTNVYDLYSDIIGDNYKIHLSIPGSMSSDEKPAVIYILDAQWDMPLVYSLYGELFYDGFLPPCVLVGVTWEGDPNLLRVRDFTPSSINGVESGGADKFYRFLSEELSIFIKDKVDYDEENVVLLGSSLGGLFTNYAMFKSPAFFSGFVPTATYFGWDDDHLFKVEDAYFSESEQPTGRMFMAIGEHDSQLDNFRKFCSLLKDRKYNKLDFAFRELEGMAHSSSKPEGYIRGLLHVFNKKSIALPPRELYKRSGTYVHGLDTVRISMDTSNELYLDNGQGTFKLKASSIRSFYNVGVYLNVRFEFDPKGSVTGAEIEYYGGSAKYIKQ